MIFSVPFYTLSLLILWVYGVVVSTYVFHCGDRGSNLDRGSVIS